MRPSWKTALDATAPTTIAESAAAAAGTSLIFSHRDHTHGAPATWAATAHVLLSDTFHTNTTATIGDPPRGGLITGQGVPTTWTSLAPGTINSVLRVISTEIGWSTYLLTGTAGGTTNFAVTNTKTLTLTATDNYDLTIPATGTAALLGTANAFTDTQTVSSGKFWRALTDGATGGFIAGAGASAVLWYRGGADLWQTPDSLKVDAAFGCNGATAQTAYASGGALAAYGAGANGYDTATHASELHAMVVKIRACLVANGIMS